jgi:excisionase family DNA binding protein
MDGVDASGSNAATGALPRLTISAEEVAAMLGLSRAKVYEAIQTGQIPSIRIGRRVLVPWRRLEQLLDGETTAGASDEEVVCTCGRFRQEPDQLDAGS